MKRVLWFSLFAVSGLVLLTSAWLMPIHFRALDASVLERLAFSSRSTVQEGLDQIALEKIGPANLLLQAAQAENAPGTEQLGLAVGNFAIVHPELLVWGGAMPLLEGIFQQTPHLRQSAPQPAIDFLVRGNARPVTLEFLRQSRRPGVHEILQNRELAKPVYFPPVNSSSGQALEAVILLTALLVQGDHLAPTMRDAIEQLAATANRGGDSAPIEAVYLDLISLGKRFNWVELTAFVGRIERLETMADLTQSVRRAGDRLPALFAAVHLAPRPALVARYLKQFGDTGLADLSFSLRGGSRGLERLLTKQQRIHYPDWRHRIVSYDPFGTWFFAVIDMCRYTPRLALIFKYALMLTAGFLLARAGHYWGSAPSPVEQVLQVKGIGTIRQGIVALLLFILTLAAGEPFLAQESQTMEPPLRLQLPVVGNAVLAELTTTLEPMLNQITVLSLLLFLAVQAIIYVLCLVKLAEIRRQKVASQLKLRLLDNEENMFDAGLYVGLGGTVAALVFLALGIVKPSLMAAYSSTLFGIIFVAVLKICHLRPFRRQLIMETDTTRL